MKLRIYSLTTDLENSGTETQVFATKAELHAELARIVTESADEMIRNQEMIHNQAWRSDARVAEARALLDLLKEGKTEEAWRRYLDGRDTPADRGKVVIAVAALVADGDVTGHVS